MAKEKRTKGQTVLYKTLYRNTPTKNWGWIQVQQKG